MFKNGVYVVESPHSDALSAFVVNRYFKMLKDFNLMPYPDPDTHYDLYLDTFGSMFFSILINHDQFKPKEFLKIHFEFAQWLDRRYRPSYYDFVKSYYDQQKHSNDI